MSRNALTPAGIAQLVNRLGWYELTVDAVTRIVRKSDGNDYQQTDPDKISVVLAATDMGVPVVVLRVDYATNTVTVHSAGEIVEVGSWYDNGSGPQLEARDTGALFCWFDNGIFSWNRIGQASQDFTTPRGRRDQAQANHIATLNRELELLCTFDEPETLV